LDFLISISTEPDDLRKARLLFQAGLYPPAIKICDHLIGQGKTTDELLIFKAEIYNQLKDYDKALASCYPVLRESPDNIWMLRTVGDALLGQKKYDEAEKYFIKTIELDESKDKTNSAYAYFGRGMIDKDKGNERGFRNNIRTAMKLWPENTNFSKALERQPGQFPAGEK
jgi:tetratricopeptide (TPR) repeat protein